MLTSSRLAEKGISDLGYGAARFGKDPEEQRADYHGSTKSLNVWQKLKKRSWSLRHRQLVIAILVLPWVTFMLCMLPFVLGYRHHAWLAWLIWAIFAACSCGVMWLSTRPRSQDHSPPLFLCLLGGLCLLTSVAGALLGLYGYYKYIMVYHVYEASRIYSNVSATSASLAYQDAGQIYFEQGTFVDSTMSSGYEQGDLYCVAPIMNSAIRSKSDGYPPVANFWAVGTDCCEKLGHFECGPVWDRQVHGGQVVLDVSPLSESGRDIYRIAARQAAETYDLTLPRDVMFLRWTREPSTLINRWWDAGVAFYWESVLKYVLGVATLVLCGLLLSEVAQRQ